MSNRKRTLIIGLYYPAVVGAGLVFILTRLAMLFPPGAAGQFWWVSFFPALFQLLFDWIWHDYAILWGIAFLALFSASFAVTDALEPAEYKLKFFWLDFAEVVLIFFAYWLLGLADTLPSDKTPFVPHTPPFLPGVYLVMFFIFLIDELWSRWIPREDGESRNRSRSVAAVRYLGMLIFAVAGIYTSFPPRESLHAAAVLRAFLGLLALYFFSYAKIGQTFNQKLSDVLLLSRLR